MEGEGRVEAEWQKREGRKRHPQSKMKESGDSCQLCDLEKARVPE